MKSILTKKGYIIDKNSYDKNIISTIKRELTVKPSINIAYAPIKYDDNGNVMKDEKNNIIRDIESFNVYIEKDNKMIIPKYYGYEKLGEPMKIENMDGIKIDLKFNGNLRDKQKEIINNIMPGIKKGGGLISVPCGFGKTTMSLYIANELKMKVLVVVHKTFLVNQWVERIKQYLPNARIGLIQGEKCDIIDKDIVIGMLQSISMKDYDDIVFEEFGTLIVDECHHISSKVFSQALPKINCKYTIGLSATPKRQDKLEKVFHWYMGPVLYKYEGKSMVYVETKLYTFSSKDVKFKDIINKYTKQAQLPTMINNLIEIEDRNKLIIKLLDDIKKVEKDRQVLILSGRVDHLNKLNELLKDRYQIGYYIGGMKEKQLKLSESKEIILATYQMVSEGFDVSSLDTIILATPIGNAEQSIGRITRKNNDDYINTPTIIDIHDKLNGYKGMNNKRMQLYKRNNHEITIYNTDGINIEFVIKIESKMEESNNNESIDNKTTDNKTNDNKRGKKKESIKEIVEEDLFVDE